MTSQTAFGLFSIAVLLGAVVFAFFRARGVKRSGNDPDDHAQGESGGHRHSGPD